MGTALHSSLHLAELEITVEERGRDGHLPVGYVRGGLSVKQRIQKAQDRAGLFPWQLSISTKGMYINPQITRITQMARFWVRSSGVTKPWFRQEADAARQPRGMNATAN